MSTINREATPNYVTRRKLIFESPFHDTTALTCLVQYCGASCSKPN